MDTITLNIGLNAGFNKKTPKTQLAKTLDRINSVRWSKITIKDLRIELGEYDGKPEKTLIVAFEYDKEKTSIDFIRQWVERHCIELSQECIPFRTRIDGVIAHEELVYNPQYKGDKFTFSDDYFIDM